MIRRFQSCVLAILVVTFLAALPNLGSAADGPLQLRRGDHISYIGNTLADRMQHDGWLETLIYAAHPQHDLTFRNLGFSGDEVKTRPRSASFGSPDEWLTKNKSDVVFCFFGYNEALRGEAGLDGFKKDLTDMLTGMQAQKYNGESAPRIVVFSPIAHENLHRHTLPDGTENNKKLALYTQAMQDVCQTQKVTFVDLFTPTWKRYQAADKPLTMNGIHLLEHGNRAVAEIIMPALFGDAAKARQSEAELQRLREVVLEKNYYWFSRYRVVDGYNVYGGRSKLNWHGQSNFDVMQREMEIFDVMTANRDERVRAVAKGSDLKVVDNNLPPLLKVKTNKPGQLEGEKHPYFGAKEAIGQMEIAKGMQVNVFASEEMFPEMINPVQMAVDTDGRLFASVWPSYPHWNPTQPRTDRILCLPDENGDGVADKCIVFADKLNSITGFEFWGGGVLVSSPPEIWFLKDTDGDDKADFKLRMLQGVSSADTHHTANAMVIGPDGGLYWSRGVFHVTNMETPTKTFRSTQTGVYRFDPRTFEISFHFPIGPNPHGDVFDQWGYQFVNDGTGGTGSYANIGKGIGNKKWFEKRVRPVAATGILSSTHFPERNNGNFLICNTIGFLGVLQHTVHYDGADITAKEIEPILFSSDPNFRPTDVEIGGDGALYVSDWCNVLIGHMQHNMRDPNRDRAHGRIYRVSYKGRPLAKRVKMKGKPIETVLQAFFVKQNTTRYHARLELSGRDTDEVTTAVARWAKGLSPSNPDEAQALLECLWVFEEHRVPNLDLLKTVFKAQEPRVRAAAIRTLGHWGPKIGGWEAPLTAAARDEAALVRAEAVKAAVSFEGLDAAEAVFEVGTRPTDVELDTVLNYARRTMNVDAIVQDSIKSGKPLSKAAQSYVLLNASTADLLKLDRTEVVYETILARPKVPVQHLRESLDGLAAIRKANKLDLLLELIEQRDSDEDASLAGLGQLLSGQSATELHKQRNRIETLATAGKAAQTRQLAYAAWIAAEGSGDDAFLAATKNKDRLRDFLGAVRDVSDNKLRGSLYAKVQPLIFDLPGDLKAESGSGAALQHGIHVDYFYPSASNVAIETLAKMKPKASGIVPEIVMNVPQLKQRDKFALRFTGLIQIDRKGRYSFFTASDDGSRIYIGDKLVVNHDGLHGMSEKKGQIKLSAGAHPITVTYFDNGGGDGLSVSWAGPGFKKQKIAADRLSVTGGETLHDVAIRSLVSIPGHEQEKVRDLASLIKAGRHRASAIKALRTVPPQQWPEKQVRPLVDNLVGYLTEIPARYRTGGPALDAVALAKSLSPRLPSDVAKAVEARLQNLDVRVIAVGTVPHRMIYDKERIAVQAGKAVEFRFSNSDDMPHNFAIVLPGALEEIGLQGEATARDTDAIARHYVPKSDKILLGSRLLQPGENQALSFEAPKTPGIYPYVCTYPGHWRRMYGALYVVADLEAYQADSEAYLAANPLPLKDELLKYNTRGHAWKFAELSSEIKPLPGERSFDVGRELFKVSSCISCHRLNEEGQEFGPDLVKLEEKKQTPEYLLQSILEPSKDIDEKFQSYAFAMDTGKIITGMVVKETDDTIEVVIDPLAKAAPTILNKDEIDDQKKLTVSIMPAGLLDKLSREEILDLLAYVYARGDKKHKLFETDNPK
ncbi:MAG: dehydrogenase [Planctomycetaceae bacterium]|nr:dehydrogenase [Planctomycetaceae bacterium]